MKSIRDTFGDTLVNIAKENKKIVAISCDLKSACKLSLFFDKYPERSFEVGIAEANGIGIAAGLGLAGYRPFIASFGSFITGKNVEIRTSISYNNSPVVIVGTHGGLIGPDGATQSAIQDISVMRSIPGFNIFQPCSNLETKQIVEYVSKNDTPTYLRISRNEIPEILPANYKFQPGKAHVLKEGKDIAVVSSGPLVFNCFEAIKLLKDKMDITLINFNSFRPLDIKIIRKISSYCKAIITVEDHVIDGGLGSTIAEIVSENKCNIPVFKHGLNNCYINSDSPKSLEKYFSLDPKSISNFIIKQYKMI